MNSLPTLLLREVADEDLATFFEQQLDADANFMAAFTAKDPADRAAFLRHWERIRSDATVIVRTIVADGQVAGHVMSYEEDGRCEVTYWLGKEYWGQGIATRALAEFLAGTNRVRPCNRRSAAGRRGGPLRSRRLRDRWDRHRGRRHRRRGRGHWRHPSH